MFYKNKIRLSSKIIFLFLIIGIFSFVSINNVQFISANDVVIKSNFGPIPENIVAKMKKYSWKKNCPVPIKDLYYVQVPYWGYDNNVHQGELIVHKKVAKEVLYIFRELFYAKFPISKMKLIDEYQGSDDKSMEDNNTSAFNFRPITGRKNVYSNHSYGLAIDINPLVNPFVTKKKVYPEKGKKYVNRKIKAPGLIRKNDFCYKLFKKHGWSWGGDWRTMKDYQHFEKKSLLKTLKQKHKNKKKKSAKNINEQFSLKEILS